MEKKELPDYKGYDFSVERFSIDGTAASGIQIFFHGIVEEKVKQRLKNVP